MTFEEWWTGQTGWPIEFKIMAEIAWDEGIKSSDYTTHHNDWENACEIARKSADNEDDSSYWQHQLNTLARLKAEST